MGAKTEFSTPLITNQKYTHYVLRATIFTTSRIFEKIKQQDKSILSNTKKNANQQESS